MVRAYAAHEAKGPLKPFEYEPKPLGPGDVEIDVDYCGICHSDLSILDNEWGMSKYPFVPGHEVSGRIGQIGSHVKHLKLGQRVGLGWFSSSCMSCPQCMSGNHNLCPFNESTMLGRHGGFADKVRCQATWATPIPDGIDPAKAGPLFCGGITVFNPIVQNDIKPTDRVGVIGIGGLGHLALQFLRKWGCEVIAFTSSDSKRDEAMKLGAHRTVNSRSADDLKSVAGRLDFILSTVNAPMNWQTYIDALAPKGRLHFVGAVLEPVPVPVFSLLMSQRSISGTPLGSPATTATMLEFCGRHKVEAVTEVFPMSKVNDAIEHLRAGKARYRIVLKNDL
jgi:alcohol/geraniol dehydrogenase (NADP+)